MALWTRFTFPLLVLALGGCVDTPLEVISSGGVGSTGETTDPSTTTKPGSTTPGDDTLGTQGGTGMGTTIGVADTTLGPSTSVSETTMGVDPSTTNSESSSSGVPPECFGPGDCPNNEICDDGQCVAACNTWGDGHYGYCLTPLGTYNSAVLCGEPMSCINSGNGNGQTEVVVCGRSCASLCDCPAPAVTGNAPVTCGDLIVGGGNECYLSCANGETCPDAMVCRGGTFCAHPVQPLAMYGNCDDIAAPCINGVCATSGTNSVCVSLCPGGVGNCDPAPAGAMNPQCDGVIYPPDGDDCYLPCNNAGNCPANMVCVNGGFGTNMCMWP